MDHLVFPPSAVSAADPHERPEVTPCIAELLRTRYNPPYLLLRVERVLEVPILFSSLKSTDADSRDGTRPTSKGNTGDKEEGESVEEAGATDQNTREDAHSSSSSRPLRHRTFRLFLSDSELLIQALLKRELHSFVSMGEVVPGCVMRVESFELRWADRIGSTNSQLGAEGEGRVAFLAVERFRTVWVPGRDAQSGNKGVERGIPVVKKKRRRRRSRRGEKRSLEDNDDEDTAAGDIEGRTHKRLKSGHGDDGSGDPNTDMDIREGNALDNGQKEAGLAQSPGEAEMLEEEDDADLHALLQTLSPSHQEMEIEGGESQLTTPAPKDKSTSDNEPQLVEKHAPSTIPPVPSKPIPITGNLVTLSSLLNPLHPLPRRNYIVSLLAIVCSISAHTWTPPPHARLPLKRDLRIVDSSIPFRSSGVHLSVFVDARNFFPRVGTVALFLGLKTHEWEGVSLNAFDRDCVNREWFVDDQSRLEGAGFDVKELKEWWGKRCAEIAGS